MIFTITLKLIQQCQPAEPILMAKYKDGMYHKGSFCGGSNNDLILITCKENIVVP